MKAAIWLVFESSALTLLGGCGSRPQSPGSGGAPWHEVTSAHFRVLSDLPVDDIETTARELERGLDALVEVAFAHPRSMVEQTTVVVFRNFREMHAFGSTAAGGRYIRKLPNDLVPAPVMLTAERLTDATRATFYHELTHVDRPPWRRVGPSGRRFGVGMSTGRGEQRHDEGQSRTHLAAP